MGLRQSIDGFDRLKPSSIFLMMKDFVGSGTYSSWIWKLRLRMKHFAVDYDVLLTYKYAIKLIIESKEGGHELGKP